jgi:hypothetical protein
MDIGTAKDIIEDMHHEINALRQSLNTLTRIAEKAYNREHGYQHFPGCLAGMMCSCGLMHFLAWKDQQKEPDNDNA